MLPKEFIKVTFLEQYKEISYKYHFLSFALLSIGIEFLGKCINNESKWDIPRANGSRSRSRDDFELAISKLMPKYIPYIYKGNSVDLYDSLRNGFNHILAPKSTIAVTNREESKEYGTTHLTLSSEGKLILVAEDFYDDFEIACNKVLAMNFLAGDKFNKPFLSVPQDNS
jgi:hypothetical protein